MNDVEVLAGMRGDIRRVDEKVDDLKSAMVSLTQQIEKVVRHEIKIEQVTAELTAMRHVTENIGIRLNIVENDMPGLREMRIVFFRAIIAVAGVVGLAVIALVLSRGGA